VGIPEDFSGNCRIDFEDVAILAGQWLEVYAKTIAPTDPGTVNLIAHWSLDGNYNDVTGNEYDAIAGASPVFDTGHIGQSVYFDAADNESYLLCQNSSDMDLSNGATISAWLKSDGLIDPYASVVTKGVQSWRLIRNNTTNAISFHFNAAAGGEYQANGVTSVIDGHWHHLLGIYEGSMVRLYVDGRLDASASAGPVNTTNDPVYIGSRANRLTDRNWIGNIDDVRIYNTALSEANILYLAEADPIVQIPNPRPTDLVFDGVIDLNDLSALFLSWLEKSYWP